MPEVNPIPDLKPGWKTTEFWITAAIGGLVSAKTLLQSGELGEDPVASALTILAAALAAVGYGISRGLAKQVRR